MMRIPRRLVIHYPILLPDDTVQDNTITYLAAGNDPRFDVVETQEHHHRPAPVRPTYVQNGPFRERIN